MKRVEMLCVIALMLTFALAPRLAFAAPVKPTLRSDLTLDYPGCTQSHPGVDAPPLTKCDSDDSVPDNSGLLIDKVASPLRMSVDILAANGYQLPQLWTGEGARWWRKLTFKSCEFAVPAAGSQSAGAKLPCAPKPVNDTISLEVPANPDQGTVTLVFAEGTLVFGVTRCDVVADGSMLVPGATENPVAFTSSNNACTEALKSLTAVSIAGSRLDIQMDKPDGSGIASGVIKNLPTTLTAGDVEVELYTKAGRVATTKVRALAPITASSAVGVTYLDAALAAGNGLAQVDTRTQEVGGRSLSVEVVHGVASVVPTNPKSINPDQHVRNHITLNLPRELGNAWTAKLDVKNLCPNVDAPTLDADPQRGTSALDLCLPSGGAVTAVLENQRYVVPVKLLDDVRPESVPIPIRDFVAIQCPSATVYAMNVNGASGDVAIDDDEMTRGRCRVLSAGGLDAETGLYGDQYYEITISREGTSVPVSKRARVSVATLDAAVDYQAKKRDETCTATCEPERAKCAVEEKNEAAPRCLASFNKCKETTCNSRGMHLDEDNPVGDSAPALFNLPIATTDGSGVYTVKIRPALDGSVVYRPAPKGARFEDQADLAFTATFRPRGPFGFKAQKSIRLYLTAALNVTTLRLPSSPELLRSSSSSAVVQFLPPTAGVLLTLEPWNYGTGANVSPIPFMVQTGFFFNVFGTDEFDSSFVVGVGGRIPLVNDTSSQLGTAIAIGTFYERQLIDVEEPNHLVITLALNVGSLFAGAAKK